MNQNEAASGTPTQQPYSAAEDMGAPSPSAPDFVIQSPNFTCRPARSAFFPNLTSCAAAGGLGRAGRGRTAAPIRPGRAWRPTGDQPYGMPVQPYSMPAKPKRPGAATAAAVLGIVSGSLGTLFILGVLAITMSMTASELPSPARAIALVLSSAVAAVAVMVFVSGIRFLKGRWYGLLLGLSIAQLVINLWAIGQTQTITPTSGQPAKNLFTLGCLLAIAIICTLASKHTRAWVKSTRAS
ncbi:MAG: hypothetical protein Q4D79_02380 [Propionibacteriaceae bacterium]|nr:hypothetical protein [Propionibacteriaceae bacterium]